MPRKSRPHDPEAVVDPYTTSVPSPMMIDAPGGDPVPLIDQAPHVGDATAREQMVVDAPVPARYKLLAGGVFMVRGHRTTMKPGKVIDSLNYDIRALASQGAQLQQVA